MDAPVHLDLREAPPGGKWAKREFPVFFRILRLMQKSGLPRRIRHGALCFFYIGRFYAGSLMQAD
jgi:hypothetical protein